MVRSGKVQVEGLHPIWNPVNRSRDSKCCGRHRRLQRNSNQGKSDYQPHRRGPRERSLASRSKLGIPITQKSTNPAVDGSQIFSVMLAKTVRHIHLQKERPRGIGCADKETLFRSCWSVMGPLRSCVDRRSQVQNRPTRIVDLRLQLGWDLASEHSEQMDQECTNHKPPLGEKIWPEVKVKSCNWSKSNR